MGIFTRRPSVFLGEALRRTMARNERVSQGIFLRPVGAKREVEFSSVCGQPRLISTITPDSSSAPGSIISAVGAQGGSGRLALESVIRGESAGTIETETNTLPAQQLDLSDSSFALKVTAVGSGLITFDLARFKETSFVEVVHTGIIVSGFPSSLSMDGARRSLVIANAIQGLDGVTDGSILIRAGDATASPEETTINLVDIETGVVTSKLFVPTLFSNETEGNRISRGFEIFDDELFVIFSGDDVAGGPSRRYVQLAKFPFDLSGQTVLNDHRHASGGDTFSGAIFFDADVVYPRNAGASIWNLMPYGGGSVTDPYISGKPDPGTTAALLPFSLGKGSDLKYWTMGNISGGPAEDLLLYRVNDQADALANGWTDVGLNQNEVFMQDYNGGNTAGFNYNRTKDSIVGFPVWNDVASTGKPGLIRLPISATSWNDGTFEEMETGTFRPDMVVPDVRNPNA